MIFEETPLAGSFLIKIEPIEDERGFFARAWCRREFEALGLKVDTAQSNISYNYLRGTLRGMHFQTASHAEAKLVRCTRGAVYDVIVDLRPESATYLQWTGWELTGENRRVVYVPEGLAHGYQTLEDHSEVLYHVSQPFAPEHAGGVRWNDPLFAIEWPLPEPLVISDKDRNWADYVPELHFKRPNGGRV